MDYEKAYKEALNRAKHALDCHNQGMVSTDVSLITSMFPELKMSEDERIMRNIIAALKGEGYYDCDLTNECIAWVEKQGEQKQFYIRFGDIPEGEKSSVWRGDEFLGKENGVSVYPAFKSANGDIVLGLNLPITKTTLHTQQHLLEYDNRPCYLVSGDYVGKDTDGQTLISNVNIIEKIDNYRVKTEKQGDTASDTRYEVKDGGSLSVNGGPFDYEKATITQKDFASKQEPKFKVGDWVVYECGEDSATLQIKNIVYGTYEFTDDSTLNVVDEDSLRLWAIQDAKDGDVLCDITNKNVLIFNEISDGWVKCLCSVHLDDSCCLNYTELYGREEQCSFAPATKEQRDTLERAMTNAGYRWDKEKLKLEKI